MNYKHQYKLWNLALPIAFESFFQMMYGLADTYVLSSYSDIAVAGVGYVNQLLDILLLLFQVIASGTSILLAQAIGAKDDKEQGKICSAAFYLSLLIGFTTSVITVLGRTDFLMFLRVDSYLLPYATDYLQIMGIGLLFSCLFTVLTAIYRSSGKAFFTSAISVIANIINILGDFLVIRGYIHVFGTVKDVALITIISNILACLVALLLLRKDKQFQLHQKPEKSAIFSILRLGIPAAGESCSYKCSQLAVTMIIGLLGAQTLAAKIYGMNLARFMVLLPNSIAIAAGIMVGVQAGEKDLKGARKTSFDCIKKGTFAVIIVDIPLILFGKFLLEQFTQQPQILKMAYMVLIMESITMFLKNVNLTLGNSLRAIKDVNYPVIISVISMWIIGVGLAWLLGVYLPLGLMGIFSAFFLDEGIRSILLLHRWLRKSL